MNTVKICNPAAEEPFETFVEGTTTVVCLPENVDFKLFFQVKDQGELSIESDGEQLATKLIDPSQHLLDLRNVLTVQEPVRSLFPGLRGAARNRTRNVREFKVTVKRGTGESASVAATFDFQLLSPAEYKHAYAKHLGECPSCPKSVLPHRFIVDWQAADQTNQCWNCHRSLPEDATQCTHCGSDQEQEDPQS